jgi:hypothetical protein
MGSLLSSNSGTSNSNQTSPYGEEDYGYQNYGGWGQYGNTSPTFWSNPTDTGTTSWGLGSQGLNQNTQGQNSQFNFDSSSLLDILAKLSGNNWGW